MSKLCLNVGSGQRRFTATGDFTWINIDSQMKPGHEPDIQCDGAHLTMYKDAEVDYFVLHQVLEHFQCNEGEGLIREAYRVLKPGGSLIVFVPNMQALCARWLGGELSTQIFMTSVYGAYMGSPDDTHKWAFDAVSLSEFLWSRSEWQSMQPFDWRDIAGMSVARDWWVMAVECFK